MAHHLREYVGRRTALILIRSQYPSLTQAQQRRLLDDLRVNGLLDEDSIYTRNGKNFRATTVYRLPYQRFSDHLIARHLVERYLDKSSDQTILESFQRGKPLGQIFRKERYGHAYKQQGWVEALIVEIPEAIKRTVAGSRELYFILPKWARNLNLYYKPFLQGLFWRSPTSITKGTDRIIGALLHNKGHQAWKETVDALVAVSIRPGHPYSADRMYQYLSSFSMAERDLYWSEYLRQHWSSPAAVRARYWAGQLAHVSLTSQLARQLVVLLSTMLTTVVRPDRDLVTRALVELGERHPRALFKHTVTSFKFNDPYVKERMLAASYGVVLSQAAKPHSRRFARALKVLVCRIHKQIFAAAAPAATTHVLQIDYAAGIVRIACQMWPGLISASEMKALAPSRTPRRSPFIPARRITKAACADGNSAIHMDFGNYTLGRLVRNRSNYDYKHGEYKKVRKQIEWRIGNLGYTEQAFRSVDAEIGRSSFYAEQRGAAKVDRYGKKYGWIAFFELYGLREAKGQIEEHRAGERTSDCDIDPSFPKRPTDWNPPFPELFGPPMASVLQWIAEGPTPDFTGLLKLDTINDIPGPWVLLEGFVQRNGHEGQARIFTFLRGLFLRKKNVQRLEKLFLSTEHPGNSSIPEGPEDYYTFFGEIGVGDRFASSLRRADGISRPYRASAFSLYEPVNAIPALDSECKSLRVTIEGVTKEGDDAPLDEERINWDVILNSRIPRYRRVPGVRVEVLYRRHAWESYHSEENEFSGFTVPAASLLSSLGLQSWDREVDFRDTKGRHAVLFRSTINSGWGGNSHKLLYLREDCLKEYLRKTRQVMVWCNWGERDRPRDGENGTQLPPKEQCILQEHLNIHRRFHTYDLLKRSGKNRNED